MKRKARKICVVGAALAVLTGIGFGVAAIVRRKRGCC